MKKEPKEIHWGKKLQVAVEESGISKEELSDKAGYARASYYNHIKKAKLSRKVLKAYDDALENTLLRDKDQIGYALLEESMPYVLKRPKTLEEAIEKLFILNQKYLNLLEIHTALITELRSKGLL